MTDTAQSYGLAQGKAKKSKALQWVYFGFMATLSVAACALATQLVAAHYGYQPALGMPWFSALGRHWYAPWAIVTWSQWPDPDGYIEHAMFMGQLLFIGPQFFILAFWMSKRKLKGNKSLHGSAAWATEDEIKTMGYLEGQGVYVGGWMKGKEQLYLRHNGPEHVTVFAPTRSGKGVGLILPTLLAWIGSSIVLDIKGENWALTSGWRKSQGHSVLRFDPSDPSGGSAAFNPLDEIRLGTLYAIQDIQNLAMMLADPDGKGLGDHWTKAAFAFFAGLLLHVCIVVREKTGRPANLSEVTLAMANENGTTQDLLEEMLSTDHAQLYHDIDKDWMGGTEAHTFIASSAREMMNKAENEAAGVLSSALVNMSLYRDPIVEQNISRSDFRIHDLMNNENPVDLFLVISPADIDRVRPLLRLMVDMIVRRICSKMEFEDGATKVSYLHRLLLLMDEFTALGKLPIIEKALAYMAGYGMKAYIIVQDITQLNAVYGKDNAIMANCHVRIAYAPNTVETAETLSKMLGTTTVVEEKRSISGSGTFGAKSTTINISEVARPLLTADECMRLPSAEKDAQGRVTKPGHMLIFTAGKSPIYGCQILYFRDPTFSARAKMKAPGVSVRFPSGISDSLHFKRPDDWLEETAADTPASAVAVTSMPDKIKPDKGFESYLKDEDAA